MTLPPQAPVQPSPTQEQLHKYRTSLAMLMQRCQARVAAVTVPQETAPLLRGRIPKNTEGAP